MVSEHKSPHGANNQSVCCNATLTLDHGKNDKYFIAFATQTDKLLPQATLMTNQLTAVINNTTSITSTHLKSVNQHNSTFATHKSAENVAAIENVSESLALAVTAPVTPILSNQTQVQLINKRTAVANDTNGRSAALERAYVHDVYEQCEEQTGAIRPRVANFLSCLDPGSIVCDVGCGNGRYLTQCNPAIVTIGVDRCQRLSKEAKERGGEVVLSDNLDLPFMSDSFDAALSLSVIHHFATTERRVNALRELARILRIGGRVIITVWALEQKNRRFESQDVLIPWQPPKTVPHYYSDEEDDDEFLPHYNAYTEESTNSSRSTGDGDSSSLSSSSPGESCYGFMRRALQKLTARKQGWFQESWTSKDTKTSSIDFEDARDLPIELRRLDDLEEPALSTHLKTRSLSSILNPPPRQIVRSRSSVPSLAACSYAGDAKNTTTNNTTQASCTPPPSQSNNSLNRRPKLIKQKQSLCDEDFPPADSCLHMISSIDRKDNSINHVLCAPNTQTSLRKQSSLNEELMAGNRLREKERVRKRIQKQTSLNEAFLCRSAMFSKRLQVIREGFTSSFKSSKGNLERATKNGINKIMQNIKETQVSTNIIKTSNECTETSEPNCPQHQHQHHHHQNPRPTYTAGPYGSYFVHMLQRQLTTTNKNVGGPVIYCNNTDCLSSACFCSTYQHGCPQCLQNEDQARRHSHESGSDSSKDGSLQSDTSVESEDSFASVIYIPKPELQQQQQQQFKQQHQNSNSSSSNSSSSNGGCQLHNNKNYSCGCVKPQQQQQLLQQKQQQTCMHANSIQLQQHHHHHRHLSSAPTSPLVMPCPPTPAHSPAAAQMSVTSPPQTMAAVTAAMALLTSPNKNAAEEIDRKLMKNTNCFNFDEAHLKQQQQIQLNETNTAKINVKIEDEVITAKETQVVEVKKPEREYKSPPKITRQTIQNLPPIPSFRKQQSLQILRSNFPIVRSSSTTGAITTSVPRLLTLELFNPATDDLDSDSSEASSPDSVDSVISAHKSFSSTNEDSELPPDIITKRDSTESDEEALQMELNTDTSLTEHILSKRQSARGHSSLQPKTQAECAKFAEQLSAKLLECEKNNTHGDFVTLENVSDPSEYVEECLSAGTKHKQFNKSDHNDTPLSLKEELRERRLMLANLSTQPSLQQSPTSSSTSSLSSHTRSSYDEDGERNSMLHLYENCKMSKFNSKRSRQYTIHPELAQLIQDDSDFSAREDFEDYEHDVILEEDEEAVAAAEQEQEMNEKLTNNNVPLQANIEAENKPHLKEEDSAFVEHSNSSSDIDSPSQDGSTTHHRYFHVFREGELDALINNHVSSLHIVSSYYERSSWCVIAEKVHVWTI